MISRCFGAALLASVAVGSAWAQRPPVKVDGAWARATPPRAEVGAVYMTLTASSADRLVGVTTPVAGKAEVHEMATENGIMRMRETPGLMLPAGQPVVLGPGSYHIMLTELKAPLKAGQSFPVHLTFASAPPADVTVTVQGVGATRPQ